MVCPECSQEYQITEHWSSEVACEACTKKLGAKRKQAESAVRRWEAHHLATASTCEVCSQSFSPESVGSTPTRCTTCATPVVKPAGVVSDVVLQKIETERSIFQRRVAELEQAAQMLSSQLQTYVSKPYLDLEHLTQTVATDASVKHLSEVLHGFIQTFTEVMHSTAATHAEGFALVVKAVQTMPVDTLIQTIEALEHKFLDLTEEVRSQSHQISDKTVAQLEALQSHLQSLNILNTVADHLKQMVEQTNNQEVFQRFTLALDRIPQVLATHHQKLQETFVAFTAAQAELSNQQTRGLSDQMVRSYAVLAEAIKTSSVTIANFPDPQLTRDKSYTIQIAYHPTLTSDPEYIGRATPGTALSAAGWQIQKVLYVSAGTPSGVQWAGGASAPFNTAWTAREGASYS